MEFGGKKLIVTIISIMLLTASILLIILLKRLANGESNINCKLDDLKGEILNFPADNDEEVEVHYSKELEDENDDGYELTQYKYRGYTIFIRQDTYDPNLYSLEVNDSENNDIYMEDNIKIHIVGTVCNKDGSFSEGKSMTVFPKISDGKLYYVTIGKSCYNFSETERRAYLDCQYIDLNSDFESEGSIKVQSLKILNNTFEDEIYCGNEIID